MNKFTCTFMLYAYLTVSAGYGQWSSFDLDPAVGDNFSDEVKPLLKGTAMSLAQVPQTDWSLARRFKVGLAYSHGIAADAAGLTRGRLKGLPALQGAVIVTKNILLCGKIGGFKSGKDVVQTFSYGFNLQLSDKITNNWYLYTQFARLSGPEDVSMRAINGLILKEFVYSKIIGQIGIGVNLYSARIALDDENDILPGRLEGQTNYLAVGVGTTWKQVYIGILGQLNTDVTSFNISVSGGVY
ncbi:MAG: hypothetical protein V3U16_03605 [Candidatus Neomarinimicrobiota bacterium]